MAKFDVLNFSGDKVSEIHLSDGVFAADVNEHLVWEVVKSQLSSRRAGSHSTLHRGEVRGGGKKPFRQKGTGQARQGSNRSPNHVGGAGVFTPKPRSYRYLVNKKCRQGALRSVLSLRANQKQIFVIDSINLTEPKTKLVCDFLARLNTSSALLVDHADKSALARSTKNIAGSKFLPLHGLNTYDILRYSSLVLTVDVIKAVNARLSLADN
jgi:large subunit ribosomal protein L4